MASLDLLRAGQTYSLSDGSITHRITTANIGLGPIRRLRQKGPFQHGVSNRGYRLDERIIDLVLFFQASSLADADDRRDLIGRLMKATDDIPIDLRWTRDNGTVRQIGGYVDGMVDFADTPADRIGVSQKFVVPFLSMDSDPVFFDPEVKHALFTGVGSAGGFKVPKFVPHIQSGSAVVDSVQSVTYAGSWRTYPIIVITGPGTDIEISNDTTGEVIDLPGLTLVGGEILTIDLSYEEKTVRSNIAGDLDSKLSEDSNISFWSLEADPEAPGGINDIRVAIASGATGATSVQFTYYDRYVNA